MLNLQPHEQEINPSNNNVLEMVLRLGILKLDMQTILYTNIHLDRAVVFRRHAVGIHPEIFLADDVGHAPGDGDADEIAELDVDAIVGFILLLDVFEVEGEGLRVLEFAGGSEFLDQGEEFVVVAAVVEHFYSVFSSADVMHTRLIRDDMSNQLSR